MEKAEAAVESDFHVLSERGSRHRRPARGGRAFEAPAALTVGYHDPGDGVRWDLEHDPGGLEAHEAGVGPTPVGRERDDHGGGKHGRADPQRAVQRRRTHHTAPPRATTSPGNTRTANTKMARTCRLVSTTVGSTSTGGFIVGARSSPMSQATAASTRSLFDMYGKKELLAKSPSPITTSRNGFADGSPGNDPSTAAASRREPRCSGAVRSLADSRTGRT